MESFSESIEIVEQNQWNRSAKPLDLLRKTARLIAKNRQFFLIKLALLLRKSVFLKLLMLFLRGLGALEFLFCMGVEWQKTHTRR
ncbi:MAG: hypothetical protein IKH22_09115 [Prevotella sp.]|nr:hypothetical protein [Prevotella sp.]